MISHVARKLEFTHYPEASEQAVRLQRARLKLGLSQGSFADRAGLDRVHYMGFEKSSKPIGGRQETWTKLAKGHGVSTERLGEFLAGKVPLEQFHATGGDGKPTGDGNDGRLRNDLVALGVDGGIIEAAGATERLGKKLKSLPLEIRRAVLGVVHVLGYPLEQAIPAARRALAKHGKTKFDAEEWFMLIRKQLDHKPGSGTLRAVRLEKTDEG